MRRIWFGVGIAICCGTLVWSCGSDSDPAAPGAGGTSGDGGPDTSGGGGSTGGDAGSAGSAGTGGQGQGGTETGGTMGGGAAGDGDAGVDADSCSGCPNGACVDGGVCVECTRDAHCATPEAHCDLERNECVECLPANDDCPSGQYCGAEKRCVKGCKAAGTTCASGICTPAHDCARCVHDGECSGQKLCGSGVCATACSASGPPDACGTGVSCCEPRCVRVDRDVSNCKSCGTVCDIKQFCGKNGCTNATLPNVCDLTLITAVLDGAPNDDQASREVLAALAARCAPAPTTRTVDQLAADVINPATGRVVVPGGEMLVFIGGRYFHKGVGFLEDQRNVPVYSGGTFPTVTLVRSSDNMTIATSTFEEPGSHDIIVIEVGREQSTGTFSLVAFGFHANGTRAAAWYFINVMLPNLTNYPNAYYVYEWVDTNPNLNPDSGDTFTLRGSGS